jgi:hypothetical protein
MPFLSILKTKNDNYIYKIRRVSMGVYEVSIKKPFTNVAKLILGIIISSIPLINWIAKGFIIESSGMGDTKPSKKMPKWKNWASLFFKGFAAYAVAFIYAIPAILVFLTAIGIAALSLSTSAATLIQDGVMSSIMTGEVSSGFVRQLISENLYTLLPIVIAVLPIILLGVVLLLIAAYLTPVAVLNYLQNRKFNRAFDMEYIVKKALTTKYLGVWILAGVITLVVTAVLSVIPLIGAQMAFFISGVISYSLYGSALRETKNKK